jgi:hypothetical protein
LKYETISNELELVAHGLMTGDCATVDIRGLTAIKLNQDNDLIIESMTGTLASSETYGKNTCGSDCIYTTLFAATETTRLLGFKTEELSSKV